jgi:hypothetical protein
LVFDHFSIANVFYGQGGQCLPLNIIFFFSQCFRGERQALRAAKEIGELLDGEALFAYCSPYKRAIGTWDIIEDYLENSNEKKNDEINESDVRDDETKKAGVEIIGMREEPRVAEQQFGNFRECLECFVNL